MTLAEFSDLAKRAKSVCVKVEHEGFYLPVPADAAVQAVTSWCERTSSLPELFSAPHAELDPNTGILFFGFAKRDAQTHDSEVTP